ncbi:hypothetical protein [Hahella ganghwensis]|uniref:hypothetical protein n=1 Tax=Hahella ganghwensis TaxID=286420 RepID=UPI0003762574|nr:hypothetical protein [Hahella ganghwensis]
MEKINSHYFEGARVIKKLLKRYYGALVLILFIAFTLLGYANDKMAHENEGKTSIVLIMAPNAESLDFSDWFISFVSTSGWGFLPLLISIVVFLIWLIDDRKTN